MKTHSTYSYFYRNGLTIVFLVLMIISLAGQVWSGWHEHNSFLQDHGQAAKGLAEYLQSGHFIQATFENWESEFLQMALFVVLTIYLRQKGSSESKELHRGGIDPKELIAHAHSPWPVKRGGIYLTVYKHSLSLALFILFILSFMLHWYGSWKDHNQQMLLEMKPQETFTAYLGNSRFWFESFQNWQSEFLSIFAIIFFSIYLREAGSSQSKRVNASWQKTGES